MADEIRQSILQHIKAKLERVGIQPSELGDSFDLVKSGLVNSLEFVEMVSGMEKQFQCQIDFEKALENGKMTTIGGLVKTFQNEING